MLDCSVVFLYNATMENASSQAEQKPTVWEQVIEILKFAAIAALIVIPIRLFIAQPFIVSGTSMAPTFEHKNYLIIDEISYRFQEPQRGEVIVFRYPEEPSQFFIKRVIGLPGETVRIENNEIRIINDEYPDGLLLDESYIDIPTQSRITETILDDEHYFVMGDNRGNSSDSRVWGALPEDLIIGRAWLRLWPLSNIRFHPGSHSFEE